MLNIIRKLNDENNYDYFILKNKLRVLLITNANAEKCGACLGLTVGYADEDVDGLAHLLEHMLFEGTKSFPKADSFKDFVIKNNGSFYAGTRFESARYYFDADTTAFKEGLEMFASFFKTPAFYKESIGKEIASVNAQYQQELSDFNFKLEQIESLCSKEYYRVFGAGNAQTLNRPDIRKKLIQFFKDKYCASKMCLIVYADSHEIKNCITKYFEGIKEGNSKESCYERSADKYNLQNVYLKKYTNRRIYVEPVFDNRQLFIYIEIPLHSVLLKTNIIDYIIYVVEKKDKGSIIQQLKSKQYSFKLETERYDTKTFSLLIIRVDLTEEGYNNIHDVYEIIRKYILNIQFNKEEYEMLKKVKQVEFNASEESYNFPFDLTYLCLDMLYYPIKNIYNYDYSYANYDEDETEALKKIIQRWKSWLIFVIGKDYFINNNDYQVEKWSKTKYKISNSFEYNTLFIVDDSYKNILFTFINCQEFYEPLTYLVLKFNMKVTEANFVVFIFLVYLLLDAFYEKYYQFITSSLITFEPQLCDDGLEFKFIGLTEKIIEAVNRFFELYLSRPFDNFDVIKERIIQEHTSEQYLPFDELIPKIFKYKSLPFDIDQKKILKLVKKIDKTKLDIAKKFYLEMFVVSNESKEKFDPLYKKLKTEFTYEKKYIHKPKMERLRLYKFASNQEALNAVAVFLDYGLISNTFLNVICRFVEKISIDDFTNEVLGEDFCGCDVKHEIFQANSKNYILFLIQGEIPTDIIETVLTKYIKKLFDKIKALSNDEFHNYKQNVIFDLQNSKPETMKDYFETQYEFFSAGIDNIHYEKSLVEMAKKIEKKDLASERERYVIIAQSELK